ncbi:MAG TPA: hypothetical protein VMR34_02275 [Candidatus Saccharimonadales bacterium]|nr:hypothetical protein [Candidatus Saccharimonadales bacterium]
MAKQNSGKAKPNTPLWWIGFWATAWWALTCVYGLVLVWQARNRLINQSLDHARGNSLARWFSAVKNTYTSSSILIDLFDVLLIVWLIGLLVWLVQLRKKKISYKAAFRDLFLTIRR